MAAFATMTFLEHMMKSRKSGRRLPGRIARFLLKSLLVALALVAVLIALGRFLPPVSTLMLARWASGQSVERDWTPLENISPHLVAAVIASEDGAFCRHRGVDWDALGQVLGREGGPSRGASTIPMQTAKNLFLWPSRSYVRKGLELPLAMALDFAWPKARTLEVYLNIAEWGEGLFGAQAAARLHFGVDAAALSPRQAALLAAALPNPLARDPARARGRHALLARIIERRALAGGALTACLR
jgi:monofunctional biosynthetic peptidoglycan transglycosylase